jgi:hypothetical protein
LGFTQDFRDGGGFKGWAFEVARDFLGDELHELDAVGVRVVHDGVDIHFVSVATDTGPQGRVHAFVESVRGVQSVLVSGRDEDEVAGNRFGAHVGAARRLALAADGVVLFLHGRQQCLLAGQAKNVDFVNEQDTLVGAVDCACFHAGVRGGFEAARLEGVVAHIAKQGTCLAAGSINVRGRLDVGSIFNQEFRHELVGLGSLLAHEVQEEHRQEQNEDEGSNVDDGRLEDEGAPDAGQHEADGDTPFEDAPQAHRLAGFCFVLLHKLAAKSSFDLHDFGFVGVLVVLVGDDVRALLFGKDFGHRLGNHRLTRTGVANEHKVALLFGGLEGHGDSLVLANDLVNQALGDRHLIAGLDAHGLEPLGRIRV